MSAWTWMDGMDRAVEFFVDAVVASDWVEADHWAAVAMTIRLVASTSPVDGASNAQADR